MVATSKAGAVAAVCPNAPAAAESRTGAVKRNDLFIGTILVRRRRHVHVVDDNHLLSVTRCAKKPRMTELFGAIVVKAIRALRLGFGAGE